MSLIYKKHIHAKVLFKCSSFPFVAHLTQKIVIILCILFFNLASVVH
jgi:hypothetical protein